MLSRRKLDRYYTPPDAVDFALEQLIELAAIAKHDVIVEPSVGSGHIVAGLRRQGFKSIYGADIDPEASLQCLHAGDMSKSLEWQLFANKIKPDSIDWVIGNPPYRFNREFIENGLLFARRGVAYLLRISYLEPCLNRRHLLWKHPPSTVIVLPRMSFTENRRKDMLTAAWFVWNKAEPERTATDLFIRW